MVEKFKEKLKKDGRSLKWFHKNYVAEYSTYNAMALQLNGYSIISNEVKEAIDRYMMDNH